MSCPGCEQSAGYHQDRERTLVGLFGAIRYQRAYYYCRRCGQGLCPFDEQAGIPRRGLTPAVEQLATLAGVVGDSFEKAKQQAEQWCRLLKEEGGATTLAVLRNWDWPPRKSQALREQLEKVTGYFSNNLARMEYPEYQAEGWQIGSGVVESACKTVVGQRLKGAGMRWGEDGTHALCHVRALYRSEKGQWQAFWQRRFTHRPSVHQPM